ncbi:hypothetical protein [Tuanshanicoccus lijuaniae]|uniref:hypothetical protein n=1 Tax=Aerococcaceae bacterium zg-1292 TaxID=2774330 RepID=UPI001BD8F7D3|nr:hypothetical protein [Aerococcaceae bacterium zg-A91]MBS4457219.1 hypothetical protein [Aerococcaceae bacterium zg-BR33]
MAVIYPPLVEEGYQHCVAIGMQISKEAVFQYLYEQGIINAFGYPTEMALSNGLVAEFTEWENSSFDEFLALYPVFQAFDAEFFEQVDGFWQVKPECLEKFFTTLEQQSLDNRSWMQLEAFFEQREMMNE